MSGYILRENDPSIVLTADQVDRLVKNGDGDAALLYLLLMRADRGITEQELQSRLRWSQLRLNAAETEPYRDPPCPLFEFLSRLVNEENPSWNGTATELAQCLSKMDNSQGVTPNWVVRTLNARQDTLLRKYNIRYVAHRTREGKSLSLRWDGVR